MAAKIGEWAYLKIAEAQALAGDVHSAHESLKLALAAADRRSGDSRWWAYYDIAVAQANLRDLADAKVTVAKISDKMDQEVAYEAIVAAQALAGDVAGAIDYSDHLADNQFAKCTRLAKAAELLCPASKETEDDSDE